MSKCTSSRGLTWRLLSGGAADLRIEERWQTVHGGSFVRGSKLKTSGYLSASLLKARQPAVGILPCHSVFRATSCCMRWLSVCVPAVACSGASVKRSMRRTLVGGMDTASRGGAVTLSVRP